MALPLLSSAFGGMNMEDSDANITAAPQLALLDYFFPGFSVISAAAQKYLHIDLNLYIPLVLLFSGLTFAWRYFSDYLWNSVEKHLMSVVDIRVDDEIYNMLMTWVASQRFSQGARRFVVNTSLNSRSWYVMWSNWREEDDEGDDEDEEATERNKKKKALAYTPTFGSHWFLYKGRLLIFRRSENRETAGYLPASEREEISVSCFGRNPWVLKELLHEARSAYLKRDEQKTLIYRGALKAGSTEPCWQRCMARTSRPFSTVILNDKVKEDLIEDVKDYLNPLTRRWYSNRGIPYRRGYLLHGPPGTGKSSLSLALAGHFKMRIYIVSLSSINSNEENLASLFAELPRRCVVLLEDIDTAGLTHTREEQNNDDNDSNSGESNDGNENRNSRKRDPRKPNSNTNTNTQTGRLSLSGLLNILDGVASQEGRVLIMTTNHVEKLDKALIRPGRVDMIVKFDKADEGMIGAIFRAIYAPLEGDDAPLKPEDGKHPRTEADIEADKKKAAEAERVKAEITAKVDRLADEFAKLVPSHEFSPAEIQGFLLKNKRSPERAVDGAADWVVDTRKEKKEKELKDAEEKRKKEEEEKKQQEEDKKKEEEEKKKEEEEEKKKSKRKSKKSKSRRKSKKNEESDASDKSESESESESEAEEESSKKRETSKKSKPVEKVKEAESPQVEVVISPETGSEQQGEAEIKVLAEEGKHGGDSGYGTP